MGEDQEKKGKTQIAGKGQVTERGLVTGIVVTMIKFLLF